MTKNTQKRNSVRVPHTITFKINAVKYDNNTTPQISDHVYNPIIIAAKLFLSNISVPLQIKLFLPRCQISNIALLEE